MAELATPVVPDAVSRIQAMLDLETKPAPKVAQPEPQQEVVQEPVQEEVQPEPNKHVEGEDAPQEQTETQSHEIPTNEIPIDQLEAIELEVTTKGEDGKDVLEKPTIKELREGYMRQKDYSRKTAEVARQREELSANTRQAIESERKQYLEALQQLQTAFVQTVTPELKDVNWNNLATNDPFEYVKLRNRADQIQNVLTAIEKSRAEADAKQKTEQQESMKQIAAKSIETLEREIPGWNDTLYQKLLKSSESVGYQVSETANWLDPRAIKLLHKAYLYDQLKAKPATENKVSTAPKVVKPGATATNQGAQRQAEAMKKLQSQGSIENAADVIRARIGG